MGTEAEADAAIAVLTLVSKRVTPQPRRSVSPLAASLSRGSRDIVSSCAKVTK